MSYSKEIKSELISAKVKNACCRKNILRAMMYSLPDSPVFRNPEIGSYYTSLLSEFYREDIPTRDGIGDVFDVSHLRCQNCRGSLLRGIFLSVGSINDPEAHEYNLDFTFKDENAALGAEKLFSMCGFEFKKRERRGSYVLYIKSSETIGEFLAAAGSNRVMFDIINARMTSDITGALNRANNTDISNITKSTLASERACDAIRFLIESERIHLLDDTLYKTAMHRLDNPELSLFALAAAYPEGVSKSTLNARLNRIIEIADKYRK